MINSILFIVVNKYYSSNDLGRFFFFLKKEVLYPYQECIFLDQKYIKKL